MKPLPFYAIRRVLARSGRAMIPKSGSRFSEKVTRRQIHARGAAAVDPAAAGADRTARY
jgi:hypothetical protein